MCKNHFRKITRCLLIILLIFAYLPLAYSFSSLNYLPDPKAAQTSDDMVTANADCSTSNDACMSATNRLPLTGITAHIKQRTPGISKESLAIPFLVLIFGFSPAFLCFGKLADILFICRFIRHAIIPHSLHAPPKLLALT